MDLQIGVFLINIAQGSMVYRSMVTHCRYALNPVSLDLSRSMFFFIAGITPKTQKIDENPKRCPDCGLYQAYQMRVDHYLNLFFIPLLKVKTGEPFMMCERCHKATDEFNRDFSSYREETGLVCKHCGNPIHKGFNYCPYCGKKLG
jgi:hypothetical protein